MSFKTTAAPCALPLTAVVNPNSATDSHTPDLGDAPNPSDANEANPPRDIRSMGC